MFSYLQRFLFHLVKVQGSKSTLLQFFVFVFFTIRMKNILQEKHTRDADPYNLGYNGLNNVKNKEKHWLRTYL